MKKRGSLELSMQTVVVLILAISLLSLGLVFIRGMFSDIGAKVTTVVDTSELTNPPNADNRLTVAPQSTQVIYGDNAEFALAFLNLKQTKCCKLEVYSNVNGVSTLATSTADEKGFSVIYPPKKEVMQIDQISKWQIIVGTDRPSENAEKVTQLYTSQITCVASACSDNVDWSTPAEQYSVDFVVTAKP